MYVDASKPSATPVSVEEAAAALFGKVLAQVRRGQQCAHYARHLDTGDEHLTSSGRSRGPHALPAPG